MVMNGGSCGYSCVGAARRPQLAVRPRLWIAGSRFARPGM